MTSYCRRCDRTVEGGLYTVPAYLPQAESGWYLLCAHCYRAVLAIEPPDEFARRVLDAKRRGWSERG